MPTIAAPKIVATLGRAVVHAPGYFDADWHERDNFATFAEALDYANYLTRRHPPTPYRIVQQRRRFVVQFVPEWKLRA